MILKPAHMEVRLKPGYWIDPVRMEEIIKKAGYKPIPERVGMTVTGKLVKQGDALIVELDGMRAPAALAVSAGPGGPDAAALAGHAGETVELTGAWQAPAPGAAGVGSLEVAALRPPPPAK